MAITGTEWERPEVCRARVGTPANTSAMPFVLQVLLPAATRQSRLRGVRKTPMAKCARC
jgi:hypothetical protein